MLRAIVSEIATDYGLVEFVPGLFLPTRVANPGISSIYLRSDGSVKVRGKGGSVTDLCIRLAISGIPVDGISRIAYSRRVA